MRNNRAVASARAFLSDLLFEIVVCLTGIVSKKDWMYWEDTDGNSLRIAKNKSIKIIKNGLDKSCTHDIFRKAKPGLIAKNSYWALVSFGKEKSIFSFVGNDGMLRCCYFESQVWVGNQSPLLLGYNVLRYIASGYLENTPRKVLNIRYQEDFGVEETWALGLPSTNKKLRDKIQCHLTNQDFLEP